MQERLAAIQAALNAGRSAEAIDALLALLSEAPAQDVPVYRALVRQLLGAGRLAEGLAWADRGLARHGNDYDLLNTRGVLLRRLGRPAEAAANLRLALSLRPDDPTAAVNLGNALLAQGDFAGAEALFASLAERDPGNAEHHRLCARALRGQGRVEPAIERLRRAIAAQRDNADAWLDLMGVLHEAQRTGEAEAAAEAALQAAPGDRRILEGQVLMLRRSGQTRRAETLLRDRVATSPGDAWLHAQLGALISQTDREAAERHLREAVALAPGRREFVIPLIELLEKWVGPDEGARLDEAHRLARQFIAAAMPLEPAASATLCGVFGAVCDEAGLAAVGEFATLGRAWAGAGLLGALMRQLARVRTEADRVELVEQHRIWGRQVDAVAARNPIVRPARRPRGDRIRLGFMSSDLREHPVGRFALPLFQHPDARFELFAYSYFPGQADRIQGQIADRVPAFRSWPGRPAREAAQGIADDRLDMLIELGGGTVMNKPEVMAYRPAPRQASWLGYPHSLGTDAIDDFVCDPWNKPTRPHHLVETPLTLPRTWLTLGREVFSETFEVRPDAPSERNGFVTFGTANAPYKYGPEVLRAWARVVAATPDARFAFIRPEAASASFRQHVEAQFAREGVSAERIVWHAVRGLHMARYNELDVSLDPFPLTGGTSTAESLWMGVPLVTLVGEMFHERLSYSILSNAGLGDLCATDLEAYHATALSLAADTERRRMIRRTIRRDLRDSPLGDTEQFARDFYDMVHRAVSEGRPRPG